MLYYLLRRINLLLVTLLILTLASYALVFLFPGDPITNLTGISDTHSAAYQRQSFAYNLTQGWWQGYITYMQDLLSGQWGLSMSTGKSVFADIGAHLPASIELAMYAMLVSVFVSLPLGIIAGLRHGRHTDSMVLGASLVGYSMPVFWLALIMILVFSLQLGLLPISGRISLLYDVPAETGFILLDILTSDLPNQDAAFNDALRHLILPTLSVSIVTSAMIIRLTRRSVVDVMRRDYIKAAYAKGLTQWQVLWRHGLKNALMPIMPQLAMQFTVLLTNAMIVEVIFSWPGIGEWLVQAIYMRDYPAIRGGMLVVSALVIMFTIAIDVFMRAFYPLSKRQIHAQV
ncbi:Dipeptide transport system permease protein [Saliniradius amylolyticus]|uniref:Dipeptide transport system permease protein n=1 Tax=Saliniradius amylolyticus TaxID=2183582 RepID=A0A2S2E111_9ALTE|nr:ABC transporter permease [Saliniradius amylolyticus]AWL11331.1 Dipeptide transport system permease protein [Saliniradius amylolyticus]